MSLPLALPFGLEKFISSYYGALALLLVLFIIFLIVAYLSGITNNILILIGVFIIFEAIISILFSQDQRSISSFGRIVRLLIGIWLVINA